MGSVVAESLPEEIKIREIHETIVIKVGITGVPVTVFITIQL